jgi:dihydrolipoamide dehydrogenase
MVSASYDIIVIGGGPGGYVAAIRAAQLGFNTACVEKEDLLGGTCLRVGCIPSKALLESSERYSETVRDLGEHGINVQGVTLDLPTMMKRKDRIVKNLTGGVAQLFKKNGVTRYVGSAALVASDSPTAEESFLDLPACTPDVIITGPDGTVTTIAAKRVIIATGSSAASLRGIELHSDRIGTSTQALSYPEVPESLIVIGAGFIGLELGSVWNRLGSKVTVLEYMPRILPGIDADIADKAYKVYRRQGLKFRLETKVESATFNGTKCEVMVAGETEPLTADRVLVSAGRIPETTGLGLQEIGVATDGRGFIIVNEDYETSVDGVYAVGDVIGGLMLAHKASEEAVTCVERIAGHDVSMNYGVIPGICYTDPEVASVGSTEEELTAAGIAYKKGSYPFRANGRAMSIAKTDGEVKILAADDDDRILGVHILGAHAGELIAEAATAMVADMTVTKLADSCHAHPTLSEIIKEAALAACGKPLHQ